MYYRKNKFVVNVWPANSALFIYVSNYCVETVKQLDYNQYTQLTRWCRGNTSALGARAPGFNSWFWQGFLFFIFLLFLWVFFIFCPKTLFVTKICNVNYLVYISGLGLYIVRWQSDLVNIKDILPVCDIGLYIVRWQSDLHVVNTKESILPVCNKPCLTNNRI